MALEAKPGQSLRVTVSKHITRESARKTVERLFLRDRAVSHPIAQREANFIELGAIAHVHSVEPRLQHLSGNMSNGQLKHAAKAF